MRTMSAIRVRDRGHATIRPMPRPRTNTTSPEATALDQAARDFTKAEQVADTKRKALHAAVVAAVRSGMSKSEAARRAGYTREHVADVVDKAAEDTAKPD